MPQCSNFTIMILISVGGNPKRRKVCSKYNPSRNTKRMPGMSRKAYTYEPWWVNRKRLPFLCGLKVRTGNLWKHMYWAPHVHEQQKSPGTFLLSFSNSSTFFSRGKNVIPWFLVLTKNKSHCNTLWMHFIHPKMW